MATSEKKVLFENTVAIALTQIVSYIMPLISLPYLSRVLGVEKFGLVFWAQAYIQYFIMITDYGFNFSAVREISIERENKDNVSIDIVRRIVREYSPNYKELLNFDVKNISKEELKSRIIELHKSFLDRKPLLSKNINLKGE